MHEHIARAMYYFEVHLLYASMVWFAAWVLTSIPRGSATAKYWIWVATSLNFILPLGAAVDRFWTSRLWWAEPLSMVGGLANTISRGSTAVVLGVVWLVGATLMFTRLFLRLRADHRYARGAAYQSVLSPNSSFFAHGIPVRFAESRQAPAVGGVLRPFISLPCGIERLLSKHELNAVLIHELAHAKRRDNLIRLIYEVGLSMLWFHPLVWIAGSRLALYRELSCDEPVIQSARGGDLISALAKLANPEQAFLLQATASSLIGHRLSRLTGAQSQRKYVAANILLTAMFGAVLLAGIWGTVAHTACCFVVKSHHHS